MWALISLALFATTAASPASQVLTYQSKMESIRNDMMTNQFTSKFEDQFKDSCQRYADNEAFNNFINVKTNIIQELQATATEEAAKAIEVGEQPKFLTIFCKLLPKIKASVIKITAAVKPCLNSIYWEKLGYSQNVTDSFLDYVCYNNGERVTSFIENGGVQCINERQIGLRKCSESAVSEEEKGNEINNDIFQSINKEDKENRMAEDCRELTELEKCVKRELDQCSNQSSSNFVTGLIDSIFNPVCEKYTRN